MFLDFYHLREQPFGVTPDPRYLYLSRTHREALASLFYGVEMGRGFLALIAQPGMGKTTVLFRLLERLRKSTYTAFLFQTQCDSQEFLRSLVADMGIDSQGHDLVQMREELNEALIRLKRADRRFVLVIDEAQNLEDSVLETVRLLSDFETPSAKLMQIIIAGQPQLAAKLARPSLIQFRQRVAVLCRLGPFSPAETDRYIDDRLQVAGYDGGPLFTSDARAIIAERSRGIPRNINNLCFNALSMGYALKRQRIDREIVLEVLEDLDLESLMQEGDDVLRTDSPDSPPEPPRAFGSKWRGELGARPFRATALAAALVLASLFLFPSLRKLFVTQLDRVVSVSVVPLAKTLGLIRPIPPPTDSPTTPVRQNAIAEPAARGTVPSGNSTVVVEVKASQTLEQISFSHFGRFDKKLLQEIRALNPQIEDINHLETGQRVVLPGRTPTSPGTDSASRVDVEPMTSARN
ncbi:MAG: AAA family ATPase [Terriglobia bacterium]|jgi:general secretion pathway protein A